jgi:hypothetical protein
LLLCLLDLLVAMTPSPVNISLGKGLSIGPKIGEGAQCSVHQVLQKGAPVALVAKCAPLPPPRKPKAKPKMEEINANSLNKEFHFYNTYLKEQQGDMVPALGHKDLLGRGREEYDGECRVQHDRAGRVGER